MNLCRSIALGLLVCLFSAASAAAQDRPATLSTLFEDIFGARGLVLNSDDVQLDGTNHAAHSTALPVGVQADERRADESARHRTSAVTGVRFTYQFDPGTGTFVRTTRSFGPILADRGETIGRNKIAFGYTYQFFSFDHLDGLSLSSVPAVFTHDSPDLGGGRADIVATANTVEATVSQLSGAVTYGLTDRVDVSMAVP